MNIAKSERREAARHRARRGMVVTGRSVFVVARVKAERDAEKTARYKARGGK